MSTISNILESIEQDVNHGIKITKRIQEKTFGLFKNPLFLFTFFTFIFLTVGYKIYHFYKQQNELECSNHNSKEKCPGYCVWDTEENSCIKKLKAGNACPDFWTTSISGKNIRCSPNKNLNVDPKCLSKSDEGEKYLEIKEGKLEKTEYKDKCSWMKNCGSWEGQGVNKFNCSSNTTFNQQAPEFNKPKIP